MLQRATVEHPDCHSSSVYMMLRFQTVNEMLSGKARLGLVQRQNNGVCTSLSSHGVR